VNRSIQALAFAIVLLGLTAARARADLAISLDNVTVAPGGTGTMDIFVTSNNNDPLSLFSLTLQITQMPGTTSFLTFTGGVDPYNNPNYVFSGESFNVNNGIPFWGLPFPTIYTNDSISGGDAANPLGAFVTIPSTAGGPNSLLATVQFQALGTNPGDQFLISVVSATTEFDDQNGNPLTINSITGGTVTITSVVPEPSSLTVVALSGLSGLLWCCWRGRKQGQSKNSPLATSSDRR